MKNIKLYETFLKGFGLPNENWEDEITEQENDMKDICQELDDIGANVIVHHREINSIVINQLMNIPWVEVRECALRLKQYLGKDYMGFTYIRGKMRSGDRITIHTDFKNSDEQTIAGEWTNSTLNEETQFNFPVFGIGINYKKANK